MSKLIKGPEREQLALFEARIEDMISDNNEVRVIDRIVDSMPLEEMGFLKNNPNKKGTNHYDDADLLKLYIYGYRHRARSSRKLAELCEINIEVIWMLRGLRPDFRTIADFRKNHAKDLKKVFREVVAFCQELDLIGKKYSQDGVKIKAVNAKEKNYTLNKLDDRIKRMDKTIERYLKSLETNDETENKIETEKEELKKLLAEKEEARKELATIRQELENKKESQKSLTDPESRLMKNNGSFNVSYNNQVLVDTESHIVVNYNVDNNPADVGTMTDLTEDLKQMLGIEEVVINITDQGYKDISDMSRCLEKGIIPEVTLGKEEESYEVSFEYEEQEITKEIRESEEKENIRKCLRSGIIPKVYEEFLSEIKVEEKSIYETIEEVENKSEEMDENEKRNFAMKNHCFVKDKKSNKVFCPLGEILRPKSKYKEGIKYCNKMACKNCKNPCTGAKFKEVVMRENQVVSSNDKKLRDSMNPKNKRKLKKEKRVIAKLKPKKEDTKIRMQTSEHGHGTMKRADGADYFLMKGIKNVNGEMGLYYAASNIRRMVNIMGVRELLEVIEAKIESKKFRWS